MGAAVVCRRRPAKLNETPEVHRSRRAPNEKKRLEQREKAGAELEAQLSTRESDLSMYVAQLQENFDRREAEWWSKQLGGSASQPPAA